MILCILVYLRLSNNLQFYRSSKQKEGHNCDCNCRSKEKLHLFILNSYFSFYFLISIFHHAGSQKQETQQIVRARYSRQKDAKRGQCTPLNALKNLRCSAIKQTLSYEHAVQKLPESSKTIKVCATRKCLIPQRFWGGGHRAQTFHISELGKWSWRYSIQPIAIVQAENEKAVIEEKAKRKKKRKRQLN